LLQATGFVHGDTNRWPELHELAMSNDQLLHDPRHWPRFQPGTDLSGDAHLRLFARRGTTAFRDVSAIAGVAQPQVTRGIATADVDGDGRLDFAAASQWQASTFYRNVSATSNAFLGLHVLFNPAAAGRVSSDPGHPRRPGSPAIGASVTVRQSDGSQQIGQVDGGTGHSGKRSADVHFGLGPRGATEPVQVVVRWRAGGPMPRQATFWLTAGWHTIWLARE
jgi:hypothetical protein